MTTVEKECFKYMVIGGGIAGVTCAQTLHNLQNDEEILLLTASPLIKAVTNFRKVTKTLEEFDVEEKPMYELGENFPNIIVKNKKVASLTSKRKEVVTTDGSVYRYDKLCLCSGGTPRVISKENPHVLGIRDTETVKVFQERLKSAQRIVVVGNGGIATELVYEIENCEVVWAIKDSSITSTFIDAGAAQFCLPTLAQEKHQVEGAKKRTKYKIQDDVTTSACPKAGGSETVLGSALGPDWHEGLPMKGLTEDSHRVHIEYKVEVSDLLTPEQMKSSESSPEVLSGRTEEPSQNWPVYVKLTNGKIYGCDFVISATGVVPNVLTCEEECGFSLSEDGGIKVDDQMQTNLPDVFAAGDVCSADWDHSTYWVQMRLWSQARQMGAYAAQSMVAHSGGSAVSLDFCFEMFAHVTRFFNYKVVLLGKFNAQGMGQDHELLVRVTKGQEYVKVVLKDGRMHGAVLIGETDLEETFENLILNQMDLSRFGEDLLNPDIDIEDFFD